MAGFDITPDGAPIETPEAGATEAYQNVSPTLGETLGTQAGSTARQVARVTEQGAYEGSGWLAQMLYSSARTEAMSPETVMTGHMPDLPEPGSVPSPALTPEEYNQRYAPVGNDGKPVSLGDKPMPEAVAKLIGDAKREEIERGNVIGRFENAHSWPANFATGMIGFMLDPLRAASAFVPGIGEEAIMARFGAGFLARTGARTVSGASAGALSQAPIAALQYGLGQQEAADYSLRDAFRDILFGGAGNAILHAGIVGPARDVLFGAPSIRTREAAPILDADAQTKHAAASASVAQLVEGRPVDVEPFFPPPLARPEPIAGLQFAEPVIAGGRRATIAEREAAAAQSSGAPKTWDTLSPADFENGKTLRLYRGETEGAAPHAAGQPTTGGWFSSDPAKAALYGDISYIDVTGDDMRSFARGHGGADEFLTTDPEIQTRVRPLSAERQAARAQTPADIAAKQSDLYRDGFSPGVSSEELRLSMGDVYAPEPPGGALAEPPGEQSTVAPEAQAPRPAGAESAATAPGRLVVAAKFNPTGELHIGKPGEVHGDLFDRVPQEQSNAMGLQMGFADQRGRFYSREEALAAVANPPELSRGLAFLEGDDIARHPEGAILRPEMTAPAAPALMEPTPAPARGAPSAFERLPRAPRRLASYLHREGGIVDTGGDIRHTLGEARARPGLINNATGIELDRAAIKAWEEGYLPEAQGEPTINHLLDALHEDLRGEPRYSDKDVEAAKLHAEAMGRNAEIDRLANDTGIAAEGRTREQFFDEVANHLSLAKAAEYAESLARAHEASLAEAERKAAEWSAQRGEAWEPDYDTGAPRSLEDMEDVYRQEETARWSGKSPGGIGGPGPAGAVEGGIQGLARSGERGIGAGRGGEPASERTAQGDQLILPGGERSARQAAEAREAAGQGKLRPPAEQQAPGGLFAPSAEQQAELAFAQQRLSAIEKDLLPEERAEIAAAQAEIDAAENKASAIAEAASCITEAGF